MARLWQPPDEGEGERELVDQGTRGWIETA